MLLALVLLSTVVQPAPAPLPERTIVFDSVCFGEGLTSRCAIPAAFFELVAALRAAGKSPPTLASDAPAPVSGPRLASGEETTEAARAAA